MAELPTLHDLGFPLDELPAVERASYDALSADEAMQLARLCQAIRETAEVQGFGGHRLDTRQATSVGVAGALPVDLPDLPGADVQIVSSNIRALGALYYAWSLDRWPP